MPGRKYLAASSSKYRFGFNGKENDEEIAGNGNIYDYGFRIYNSRIGKFLSVDPLAKNYPWYSPYQFSGNTPIQAIDLDGLEEWVVTRWYDKNNNVTQMRIFTVVDSKNKSTHINLHFANAQKKELANGNKVLYLHLQAGTDKVFSTPTYGSALSKDEMQFFDTYKKNDPIGTIDHWSLEPGYSDYKTKNDKKLATKYTEYDAFNQFKVPPPQKPKESTHTTTTNYSSNIAFENLSKHVDSDYDPSSEVNKIYGLVKAPDVIDYSITIKGNIYSGGSFDKGGGLTGLNIFTVYSNYGELAIARANTIKELLVAKGLDPSKIRTELGDPNKGMNADYNVTTTKKASTTQ